MRKFRIGFRIIKTVIAVFVCLLIDTLRTGGTPFYATIAAVLCMQKDKKNSIEKAKNREIATIISGLLGMGFLSFEKYIWGVKNEILRGLIVSLMLIVIIEISLIIKKENISYFMCVVFLSVTVAHVKDSNPIIFGLNRILDTSIGIIVSLIVNNFPIKIKKLKNK